MSMRPRSAALLPVSTASTGLLHLLVGAQVHHVRSDTVNVAAAAHASFPVCDNSWHPWVGAD